MQSAPMKMSLHLLAGVVGAVLLVAKMVLLNQPEASQPPKTPDIAIPRNQPMSTTSKGSIADRQMSTKELCFFALNHNKTDWTTNTTYADAVQEAQRRGLTVGDCHGHLNVDEQTFNTNAFREFSAYVCNRKYHVTNVRTGPSAQRFSVAFSLGNYEQVTVIASDVSPVNGSLWYKVRTFLANESEGYIDSEFVSEVCHAGTAPTSAPIQKPPTNAVLTGRSSSLWVHNKSTLRLSFEGDEAVLSYVDVNPSLRNTIRSGDILFRGVHVAAQDGGDGSSKFVGRKALFSNRCGKIIFEVTGVIRPDERLFVLNGLRPVRNSNCSVVEQKTDSWSFEYTRSQ